MKVAVERSALLKALSRVQRVAERRNTIPILGNAYLKASGDGLTLKASDLDIEVTETVPAQVGAEGATTLPVHTLHDIVRKLPDGSQVGMEEEGGSGRLVLRTGRSRFQLATLPAADFPDISAGELPHAFVLPADAFRRLIDKTQFAISTDETRYYLNGVYLHVVPAPNGAEGHLLRAVATDGHRLARVEIPAPEGAEAMPGVIVPRKAVGELLRLVDGAGSGTEIALELSPAKLRARVGGVLLTTKLIDGTFPDYQRVIPSGNDKRLTMDKARFTAAVDLVSTISSERGRAVKLSIAEGRVTLTVTNPDAGSAVEEVEAEYDASALEVGFNARYLLDIAERLDGDTAVFKLADPGSPTLVQDVEGAGALYVLMPMRV